MCQTPQKPNNLRAESTKTDPCADTTSERTTVSFDAGRPAGGGELI